MYRFRADGIAFRVAKRVSVEDDTLQCAVLAVWSAEARCGVADFLSRARVYSYGASGTDGRGNCRALLAAPWERRKMKRLPNSLIFTPLLKN